MYRPIIIIILFITRKNSITAFLTIQQQSSFQYSPLTCLTTNDYNSKRINVRCQNEISSKISKTILNEQSYHTQSPHHHHPSPHLDHKPTISPNDLISIERQLGYTPPNLHSISARRRSDSSPLVIKTYPLGGGADNRRRASKAARRSLTPFPTLYWLSHPEVSRAVSDLERRGYVRILEDRIFRRSSSRVDEDDLVRRMVVCHGVYALDRWMTLTKADRDMLELRSEERRRRRGGGDVKIDQDDDDDDDEDDIKMMISPRFVEMIRDSGVAGTDYRKIDDDSSSSGSERCLASVKCLHAHYAHYCSQIAAATTGCNNNANRGDEDVGCCDINVVGEMVHEILRDQFPELDLEIDG